MRDIRLAWLPEKEACTVRRTDHARIAEVIEKKAHESGGVSHTSQLVFVDTTRKSGRAVRRRSKQQQQRGGDVGSHTSSGGRRVVPGMRSSGLRHGGTLCLPSLPRSPLRRDAAEQSARRCLWRHPANGGGREEGRSPPSHSSL
ncbi:hypothetical protein ISCGN_003416 [Ixodes scapularis]